MSPFKHRHHIGFRFVGHAFPKPTQSRGTPTKTSPIADNPHQNGPFRPGSVPVEKRNRVHPRSHLEVFNKKLLETSALLVVTIKL